MIEIPPSVIIDNGSYMCKGGLAGEETPRCVMPSIVGRQKNGNGVYVGNEAQEKKSSLQLVQPIKHGLIHDWEEVSYIWDHCIYKGLRVNFTDQPCLLTEVPNNPKLNRERTTQIMFEKFNIPAFYLSIQASLSILAVGRSTGLVLDSGYGVTQVVSIQEGKALPHAMERSDFAGDDLTESLKKLLKEKGANLGSYETEIVNDIKQKHCYVALDYESELKGYAEGKNNITYELPDGQNLTVGSERIRCSEALFKPTLVENKSPSIQDMVNQSISKCDAGIRQDLLGNIVISGGSTLFSGFQGRLKKQITALAPSNTNVNVFAPENRKYSVWIGGSILSLLSSFQNNWIKKAQYEEYGASIVHKKC